MIDADRAAGSKRILALAIFCLCGVATLLGARDLEVPGLYYDEVIQAEPAVQFLAVDGAPVDVPGMQTIRLFGGWFPVMTQTYMGALKSQALIPAFATVGASKLSLRATTFAWGLCGLIFSVLWAYQLLGLRGAVLTGALLAVDPGYLFISRHDWGSFSLALLCRSSGFTFFLAGARRLGAAKPGAAWRLGVAGLLLGAGLYNKIDSAVVLLAVALAALVASPGDIQRVLRGSVREHFRAVAAFFVGATLGALPLLASLGRALTATSAMVRGGGMTSADWGEKLNTLAATLDGSYFHRLMLAGGDFEKMFSMEGAATGLFPGLLVASALTLVVLRLKGKSEPSVQRVHSFLLLATLMGIVGMFFTPRAIRVHHVLNLYPLPHLLGAAALQALLFSVPGGAGGASVRRAAPMGLRVAAGLALAGSLASSVWVDMKTLEEVRSSRGRGRWSDALERFGGELSSARGVRVVSFSWGLAGPLRFVAPNVPVEEPFWKLWRPGGIRRPWLRDGDLRDVYLVQEERFAVFQFGAEFAQAIAALPPESVEIRQHTDRSGDPTFTSVRFTRPHRLTYRSGFEVLLR